MAPKHRESGGRARHTEAVCLRQLTCLIGGLVDPSLLHHHQSLRTDLERSSLIQDYER